MRRGSSIVNIDPVFFEELAQELNRPYIRLNNLNIFIPFFTLSSLLMFLCVVSEFFSST